MSNEENKGDSLDSLVGKISNEAAELLYERMSALGKVMKAPYNHYEWAHHPAEFLPADVCCDFEWHTRFILVLRNAVTEVLNKHLSNNKFN